MQNHHSRAAYTLIEILVATAVSMILMLAIMRMFGGIGESLNRTRADMNLALELRRVESILQRDLDNRSITTVTTQVTGGHGGTNGYFTYQEGPMWTPSDNEPRLKTIASGAAPPRTADDLLTAVTADATILAPQKPFFSLNMAATDTGAPDSTVGDLDDQLAFTVDVKTKPTVPAYRGRGIDPTDGLGIVASREAEVAWFVRGTTLYRRVLLIDDQAKTASLNVAASGNLKDDRTGETLTTSLTDPTKVILYDPNLPNDSLWGTGKYMASATPLSFYDIFDVSVRWIPNPSPPPIQQILVPNTLPTLSDRRNRFGCDRNPSLPYPSYYERPPTLNDQTFPAGLGFVAWVVPLTTPTPPPVPDSFGGDFWESDPANQPTPTTQPSALTTPTQPRRGEDAVIKNVLSFDVKAWIDNDDPTNSGTPLPAYFADLGWRGVAPAAWLPNTDPYNDFSRTGRYGDSTRLPTGAAQMSCIYDTWWNEIIPLPTPHELQPPYGCLQDISNGVPTTIAAPLRAIQVTLRVFEPQFRTVQEVRLVKRLE